LDEDVTYFSEKTPLTLFAGFSLTHIGWHYAQVLCLSRGKKVRFLEFKDDKNTNT